METTSKSYLSLSIVRENLNIIKNEVFTREDGYKKISEDNNFYYVTAWNKLYSRKILTNNIFPIGKIHEDEFSIHHILERCNCIVSINECLYFYVQRNNSIMHCKTTIKKLDGYYAKMDRYNFFINKGYKDYAFYALRGAYSSIYLTLKQVSYRENKEILNRVTYNIIKKLKFNPRSIKLIFTIVIKKLGIK